MNALFWGYCVGSHVWSLIAKVFSENLLTLEFNNKLELLHSALIVFPPVDFRHLKATNWDESMLSKYLWMSLGRGILATKPEVDLDRIVAGRMSSWCYGWIFGLGFHGD